MTLSLVNQHRYYWEDADHLIGLAQEYDSRIGREGDEKRDEYYRHWKYRLARMSFIARMMAVEALLNNIIEAFGISDQYICLKELRQYFVGRDKFPGNFKKRKNRPLQIPLKWKLYLAPYICNEKCRMERDIFFHYEDGYYRKFRRLIMIRNEFVHTHMIDKQIDIHMGSGVPAQSEVPQRIITDEEYSACCQEVGIGSDPICFQVDNARVCSQAMNKVVQELDAFLGGRVLTEEFWDSEELSFDS